MRPCERWLGRALVAGLAAMLLPGCGSGGSTTSTRPDGVAFGTANAIRVGTSKATLDGRLGDPVLTSGPTQSAPGGCVYYTMKGRPLSDVWQFCLDGRDRVSEGATLYSPSHAPPPQGASAAREILIARGDAICQSTNGDLAGQTKELARLVGGLSPNAASDLRRRAAALTDKVATVLGRTRSQLHAFAAPSDERSALAGYLQALASQASVLHRAAGALANGRDQRYVVLRDRLNRLADPAIADARQYGFDTCSTVKFS